MYCDRCGKPISGQELFCPYCGASQTDEVPAAAQPVTGSPEKAKKPHRGKRGRLLIYGFLGLAALLVLALAADFALAQIKSDCPDPVAYFSLSESEAIAPWAYDGAFPMQFDRSYPSGLDAQNALAALKDFETLLSTSYGANPYLVDNSGKAGNSSYDYELSVTFPTRSLLQNNYRRMEIYYVSGEGRWFFCFVNEKLLNFVPVTAYVPATAAFAQTSAPQGGFLCIEGPERFFGVSGEPLERNGQTGQCFHTKEDATQAAAEYAQWLGETYGFTMQEAGETIRLNGETPTSYVTITVDQSGTYIELFFGEDVTLTPGHTDEKPDEPTSEAPNTDDADGEEATWDEDGGEVPTWDDDVWEAEEPDSVSIPDFISFCNGCVYEYTRTKRDGYTDQLCFWNYDEATVNEYLELLQTEYHFKLVTHAQGGSVWDLYTLVFDGDEPDTTFTLGTFSGYDTMLSETERANVSIVIDCSHYAVMGQSVRIFIADGLKRTDTGERTTADLDAYEGSAAAVGADDPNCLSCHGTGKCNGCNGYGGLTSTSDGRVVCEVCNGSGLCSICGGSGEREK